MADADLARADQATDEAEAKELRDGMYTYIYTIY